MVVELCIDKKFVLKRECLQMSKHPLHTTFISVFNQPFLLLVCMYQFFCSFLVVDSLLHISSSWFLSPYLGVLFTEKVFTISPIPGLLESLSMDISECS